MENFNLGDILAQAQAMQAQMEAAQDKLSAAEVTGTSGGGLVTATVKGTGELVKLVIKPEACDPTDTETLADLVVAAVRDATHKVGDLQAALLPALPEMPDFGGMGGGMGGPAGPGGMTGLPGRP
jgi:DNA-binding YbaB/EbfC family protein